MSKLFRKTTTKPIPEGATIVTCKGGVKLAKWTDARGKEHKALLNLAGDRLWIVSKKWYGRVPGVDNAVPLCTNKDAAQMMLADLIRKAEMEKLGVVDRFEPHRKRTLADHLAEWEADLKAGGASEKHVTQTAACVRRLLDGCGFTFADDVTAPAVQAFLASLRSENAAPPALDAGKEWYTRKEACEATGLKPPAFTSLVIRHRLEAKGNGKARRYSRATVEALLARKGRGRSVKTSNLYLAGAKQFFAWMVQNRRTADNPLAHLSGGNVQVDRRHDRRALDAAELRQVLDAALASPKPFRGLDGRDRHHLYLTAMTTGYRAEELANLEPESFALDADPPTATLPARLTKNKTTATQPLPDDAAEAMRVYLAGKPSGKPVWPGTWFEKAAEMLRIELDVCGIPYAVEGPDGPLYADFHALRHSFVALMDKAGVSVKEAMQLARHSDPKLTLAIYGQARLHDLGAAVGKLPTLLPVAEPSKATGTEG